MQCFCQQDVLQSHLKEDKIVLFLFFVSEEFFTASYGSFLCVWDIIHVQFYSNSKKAYTQRRGIWL